MNLFKRRTDTFDYSVERTCLNCAATFQGRYCPRCGEKVVEERDRSLAHFFSELLNAFTFIDGKFATSLRTLILRPGKMSKDIVLGLRQPYMKQLAFFFVGNFIYFLIPIFETFNTSFNFQVNHMPYKEISQQLVTNYIENTGIDISILQEQYNASSANWAKMLLVLLIIYMLPFIALVNYTRRCYLLDHLSFSIEFMTYVLFVPTILLGIILLVVGKLFAEDMYSIMGDRVSLPLALSLILYFFILGVRRFYEFTWWRTLLNSLLLIVGFYFAIMLYRFTLFVVTMYTL